MSQQYLERVEKQYIKSTHKLYAELDHLCFLAKNLYNATLYTVRQHYFSTKQYLNYNAVNKLFTSTKNVDYIALPAKVSKMIQMDLDKNFKSFFTKRNKGDVKAKIPKYKDSKKGRHFVHYTAQALKRNKKQPNQVGLSGTDIWLDESNFIEKGLTVSFIRLIHNGNRICIELGYKLPKPALLPKKERYASIDLGVNNLATISSNVTKPFIINGKPLKSANQHYNKQKAKYQKLLPTGMYHSKRMNILGRKRSDFINTYLHQSSRHIVNYLVSNDIDTLVVGYNKGWKQSIKMSKESNQKFVYIPFLKFVNLLQAKCEELGIEVVIQEESYTSKCSFLDDEKVTKHKTYLGSRVKRGLFKSQSGKLINADLNGSLNILKKYLTKKVKWNAKIFADCLLGSSSPVIVTMN